MPSFKVLQDPDSERFALEMPDGGITPFTDPDEILACEYAGVQYECTMADAKAGDGDAKYDMNAGVVYAADGGIKQPTVVEECFEDEIDDEDEDDAGDEEDDDGADDEDDELEIDEDEDAGGEEDED